MGDLLSTEFRFIGTLLAVGDSLADRIQCSKGSHPQTSADDRHIAWGSGTPALDRRRRHRSPKSASCLSFGMNRGMQGMTSPSVEFRLPSWRDLCVAAL
jgi:hypothetical protein